MPFASYIRLFADQGRLLSFGFVMAFSSSFGQTYFIGIFGPAIQTEFGLSHTLWGTIYLVGTLASATVFPWSGALIDRFSLPRYTLFVSLLLIVACVFTSLTAGDITNHCNLPTEAVRPRARLSYFDHHDGTVL